VATFYTLLAQFRLVDPQSSFDIMLLLGSGCVTLPFGRASFSTVATAKKCGILTKSRKRLEVYGCKDAQASVVTSDSALFHDTSG